MKKTLITSLIAASMAVMAGGASADTGTINFQGEITNSACSIGGGQLGSNMTVSMGTISTNQFVAAGDRSPLVDFTISLLGCDTSVSQSAAIGFTAGSGSVLPGGLLSLENSGGAQNVAIGLQDQNGADVNIGGAATTYTLINGNNNFNFKAFYEALTDDVQPGSANGRAIFEVTYS